MGGGRAVALRRRRPPDFRARAPAAQQALPTWEHFAPVLVAAGAAAGDHPRTTFPITGFWMEGAFTRRSVQFG